MDVTTLKNKIMLKANEYQSKLKLGKQIKQIVWKVNAHKACLDKENMEALELYENHRRWWSRKDDVEQSSRGYIKKYIVKYTQKQKLYQKVYQKVYREKKKIVEMLKELKKYIVVGGVDWKLWL